MSATIIQFPIRPDAPARRLVVHLHNMDTNYIRDAILPHGSDGADTLNAVIAEAQQTIGRNVQCWGFRIEYVRTSP